MREGLASGFRVHEAKLTREVKWTFSLRKTLLAKLSPGQRPSRAGYFFWRHAGPSPSHSVSLRSNFSWVTEKKNRDNPRTFSDVHINYSISNRQRKKHYKFLFQHRLCRCCTQHDIVAFSQMRQPTWFRQNRQTGGRLGWEKFSE